MPPSFIYACLAATGVVAVIAVVEVNVRLYNDARFFRRFCDCFDSRQEAITIIELTERMKHDEMLRARIEKEAQRRES